MITVETTRICKVCGIEKPIDDFKKTKGEWRYRTCGKCYYALHRENMMEQAKRHYNKHRSEILVELHNRRVVGGEYRDILNERGKEYYKKHRDNNIEKAKQRYFKNRDGISLRLHNKLIGDADYRERMRKNAEDYYSKLRQSNLEVYGTACSPSRLIKVREFQRQKSTQNKQEFGYAKPIEVRQRQKAHYLALRQQALEYYGGKCECCGEVRYDMLTFDHKIKTYYKDKVRGVALTYDVIKKYQDGGYPNKYYRILCWNCNMTRGFYGYCPHESSHNTTQDISKRRTIKLEMIQAYGGHCVMCGEVYWEFLTIDHINGNGSNHRRSLGSKSIYTWLKEQGWPQNGYRLLCANCNCSKKRNKWAQEVKS